MSTPDQPGLSEIENRLRNDEEGLIAALEQLRVHEKMIADQTDTIAQAISLVKQLKANADFAMRLLGRALHPYMPGGSVFPSPGIPADFRDDDILRSNEYYTKDDVLDRMGRDALPLPPFENNEGYAQTAGLLMYWLFGLSDYLKVMKKTQECAVDVRRVFDFGGSTGRVARHFYCQDEKREVWWCDFKVSSVQWSLKYFPAEMRVFLNTNLPHLPIPDGYFDVVSAFSVFTHIDDLETAWLLELKRVVRPGGMLYLTIHDDTTWCDLKPDDRLAQVIRSAPNGRSLAFDGSPMPDDRVAFQFTHETNYNCHIFHSQAYIRKNWGRFFDVVEILPNQHGAQAVVVCLNNR